MTRALLRSGWPVRALVRDASSPAAVKLSEAGAKPFIGTFSEPKTLRAAMSGAHGVFSVLPSNLTEDDEVRFGMSIADIATERGVAHLVYSSGGRGRDADRHCTFRCQAPDRSTYQSADDTRDDCQAPDLHGCARAGRGLKSVVSR